MIGLCLEGGGARGAYQIGAAKALQELGILSKINHFSGTSIGAVNAVLLASLSIDECIDLWTNITPEVLIKTENLFKRIIKEKLEFSNTGIFEITELENILKSRIDFDLLRKKNIYITLADAGDRGEGVVGMLKSGYDHYIKNSSHVSYSKINELDNDDEILNHVISSCSIPIAFPPKQIDDRQYVDGGVYDNVPIQPLLDAGCDEIIIIRLHKFSLFDSTRYLPFAKIHEVKVKHYLGGVLNFDGERSKKLFQAGYEETLNYYQSLETI